MSVDPLETDVAEEPGRDGPKPASSRIGQLYPRTLLPTIALLALMLALTSAVGRTPPTAAPTTTLSVVGRIDQAVFDWAQGVRLSVLTGIALALNLIGSGAVTIPVRAAVGIAMAVRRRGLSLMIWVTTWLLAEASLSAAKAVMHRGRPPKPLVATHGYSFPSGHVTATASIAVAVVLTLVSTDRQRYWIWVAIVFIAVVAWSRVYLDAHWFSDVLGGAILGSLAACGSATIVSAAEGGGGGGVWVRSRPPPAAVPPDPVDLDERETRR